VILRALGFDVLREIKVVLRFNDWTIDNLDIRFSKEAIGYRGLELPKGLLHVVETTGDKQLLRTTPFQLA
jgi:hypothetical protein